MNAEALQALCLGPYTLEPADPSMPIMTLAPMDGIGNRVYRLLCARLGARIVGAGFLHCRAMHAADFPDTFAWDYADLHEYRSSVPALLVPQISGNDPALIAAGARRLEALGAPVVDLNFGCSVPRVTGKGAGAAHLLDLDRLLTTVRQTVEAVDIPVTIKTRIGWDHTSINILDVVRGVEDAGARAVAIHARTAVQRYEGRADWTWIARVREISCLPIIGNGDVRSPQDAVLMQQRTGCDAVMIGRAAVSNPWIFAGRTHVSLTERIDLAIWQIKEMVEFRGEPIGVLATRKHLAAYFSHLPRNSPLRQQMLTTTSADDLIRLMRTWRRSPDLVTCETQAQASPPGALLASSKPSG